MEYLLEEKGDKMFSDPTVLIGTIVAGISRGMIYFLLAAGLTLVFGVLNVVNFSHGTFYMLGVFICYTIGKSLGFGFIYLVVPIILIIVGAITEFLLFRRIYKAEHAMQLLLSTGVSFILSDLVRLEWGVSPKSLGMTPLFRGFYNIGGVIVTKYNLVIIAATLMLALFMFLILFRTRIGSVIRACTIDHEMTMCVGVNVSNVFLIVFSAGVGLAGIAAAVAAPNVSGILGMDAQMILVAFSVVIVGGVGSVGGTLIAALMLGIMECLGILLLPDFAEVFMYIIVVAVLFWRPSGLFGKLVS